LDDLAQVKGHPSRIVVPVAGDSITHKHVVIDLIDSLGFDGVDSGSAADSWRQEMGTPYSFGANYTLRESPAALDRAVRTESQLRRDMFFVSIKGLTPGGYTVKWVREQHERSYEDILRAYEEHLLGQKS
jgi:hypothetical protein